MKFVVERGPLVAALTRGGKLIRRANTMPILGHVKIEARQDSVMLVTTDVDSHFTIEIPAAVARKGATTVDHRVLQGFASMVPDGAQIEIEFDPAVAKTMVRAGRARAGLPSLPVEEFHQPPADGGGVAFTLPGKELAKALGRVAHAVSTEETRYYLCGAYMHLSADQRLTFVATNGHRLARAHMDLGADMAAQMADLVAPIVPTKAVSELLAMANAAEAVDLEISSNRLRAEIPGTVYESKLIDGTYPDYQRAIPAESGFSFETGRAELANAAHHIAIIVEQTGDGRIITIDATDGLLSLTGKGGGGEINDEVEAHTEGGATQAKCNATFLADALDAFNGGPIHCRYDGNKGAMIFTEPGDDTHLQLVMTWGG